MSKKIQREFKSDLSEIKRGRCKSEEQESVLKNIEVLYKVREKYQYFLMIILQLYLKLDLRQLMKKDSK